MNILESGVGPPFGHTIMSKKTILQSPNLSSGKGSDTLDDGVGPPFDHTMADPAGHYLFVDVNEHEVGGGDGDDGGDEDDDGDDGDDDGGGDSGSPS